MRGHCMARGLAAYFYALIIGLSLQAAENVPVYSKTVLERIKERVKKEKSLSLFVGNFGFAPFMFCLPDNIMPLVDFLKVKADSQNVVSLFRSSQIGDTKKRGRNQRKYAIIGNPNCFEVCLDRNQQLRFIDLGSTQDINVADSRLQRVLEYTGYNGPAHEQQKRSKATLALNLAQGFEKENKVNEAVLWYMRSVDAGNRIVAPYYFAKLLDRQASNSLLAEQVMSRNRAITIAAKIYKLLAEQDEHLGSIRECAGLLERFDQPLLAAQWYKEALFRKGHIASMRDMIRCADMLWEPWYLDEAPAPNDYVLDAIKGLYGFAAYTFGDEEGVNKLADLMREHDYENNNQDGSSLEREALIKQIELCDGKVTSNTLLRLALLDEELYNIQNLKSEIENHKIYSIFLPAAQAGNFPAMVKLYHLSLEADYEDTAQFWFDTIESVTNHILGTSKIKHSLLYLGYLDTLGEELFEDVCAALNIEDSAIFENKEYLFEPIVELAIEESVPIKNENSCKRKRGHDEINDEDCCDPDIKRMRRHEFEQ